MCPGNLDPRQTTYGYDDAGRLTAADSPTSRQTTAYERRGLPQSIVTSSGINPSNLQMTRTEQRRYDGDARLLETATSGAIGPSQTRNFAWDVAVPVARVQNIATSGILEELAYGPNRAFSYVTAITAFSYDAHGSTLQDAEDPSTAPLARSSGYDAFGQAATPDGTGLPTFGYRGELTVGNVVHLRARDYDPATSRFTTRDPRDGVDGTPVVANPYHYADNDPLNRSDPTGMRPNDNLLAFFETFGIAPITGDSLRQCGADIAGGILDTITFGFADSGHNGANKGSGCYRLGEGGATVGAFALDVGLLKAARDARRLTGIRGAAQNTARGPDFVAGPMGSAPPVPVSQSRMAAGLDDAGFPRQPTSSPGMDYTLPDGSHVRLMDPAGAAGRRASFTNANGQPINPFTGKPVQPPPGLTPAERLEYVRARTHVEQGR